jgi:hypothetical protein
MRVAHNEEGDDDGSKSNGNKGVVQQRGRWQWRQERWQQGWRVCKDNGNDMSNGNGDEAGGQ